MSQLGQYIPAEVVAAYTTVVGVLPLPEAQACSGDFTARWIALGVFALLTPIALQVLFMGKWRSDGGRPPYAIPWFEHMAALAAFLAWALILPLSPVSQWCQWEPQYGVAIGATLILVLGLAARLARPSGKYRQR